MPLAAGSRLPKRFGVGLLRSLSRAAKCTIAEVEIKNESAESPLGLIWHVKRALSWIDPADLHGVEFIRLADDVPEASLKYDEVIKQARAKGHSVYGMYYSEHGRNPSHILLVVKDKYRPIPALYRLTPVTTLWIARTLAHEVGHHLIAKRGYIFQPGEKFKHSEIEEEFCDRYAFGILKKMQRRWYYRLGMWGMKDLASTHYMLGILDWKEKKYKAAAERWYNADQLDPDHKEALRWYWRAKEIAESEQKKCEIETKV